MIGGVCTLKRFDTLRPLRSSKGKMLERNLRPTPDTTRQHEIASEGTIAHARRSLQQRVDNRQNTQVRVRLVTGNEQSGRKLLPEGNKHLPQLLTLVNWSRLEAIAEHQQRNDRTHRLLAATDNETVDELRKGRRPNVHLLLLRLSVDTVSDSLERQRYCLIQILRQRRPWHILCTVNQIGYLNTKLLTWKPLNVGY